MQMRSSNIIHFFVVQLFVYIWVRHEILVTETQDINEQVLLWDGLNV